uniref:F-box associated domain-containing protein n=1 Tax=Lactuca sativa TaxID=4236 RepID=A0A9R1XBM2_LACSA|nr:hypothetical protein LSAT_V11C500236120 [Lactuca sativa]
MDRLSLLTSELIIEILSRTSLQTFATVQRQFLPSFGSNNHDINWLPHTCTILASSLCGLLLFESYDPDEYVSKILFVIKPTTSDAKWIPFPTSEYTATKFALVVISSNRDMPTEKVYYDYYNIELFSSTTWQWMEFQNMRLPSSVYPVSDEAVTSGSAVYFLLSNDTILRFDIYSEEHILIFAPSTINELKPYASRLIKFHGKLGYLSISGDSSWSFGTPLLPQRVADVVRKLHTSYCRLQVFGPPLLLQKGCRCSLQFILDATTRTSSLT